MSKTCKLQITDDNHTVIESFEFHPDSDMAKKLRDENDAWVQLIRVDGSLFSQIPDDGESEFQTYVPVNEVSEVGDETDIVIVREKAA